MALEKQTTIDKIEIFDNDNILRVVKRVEIVEESEVISVSYDAERYAKARPKQFAN